MYISEFNAKYGTNYADFADCQNAQMYVINGIVVDFFDSSIHPTSEQVLEAWKSTHGEQMRMFSLVDIEWIIAEVAKYYN